MSDRLVKIYYPISREFLYVCHDYDDDDGGDKIPAIIF